MTWRAQMNDHGVITRYKDADTGETISAQEWVRRQQVTTTTTATTSSMTGQPSITSQTQTTTTSGSMAPLRLSDTGKLITPVQIVPVQQMPNADQMPAQTVPAASTNQMPPVVVGSDANPAVGGVNNPLIQPGARLLSNSGGNNSMLSGGPPTTGQPIQGKNLRMEGIPRSQAFRPASYKAHGFLDATSIAILLPTLVLLAIIIAAAHKKRLFPWQTIRTFNPPSGLLTPLEYERSYLCPPNLRRHGRFSKRNPSATWTDQDGVVIPFGFLARTHLPVTIPLGRLPNKNMFVVAPSGSGKTTLMRAVIKAMLAKPCVIIALEAKANDPNLDEKREGFKYTVLPEAQQAGFATLYFNPLDQDSIHWNPLDLDPITFASSIVQDVNSLPPEQQHWAERDHGYIAGLATMLKWGAVMVTGEDENGLAAEVKQLDCNPAGLMRLVNNRRNIAESLRRLKSNPNVDLAELAELTQTLSSIIRTETDWDKNIQGIRGRLRMFKNANVLRVTERSNIDMHSAMHKPTVLIFGAPASLGPDAESLAACFVYQLQQALHTRYGTVSVLPLFAFFDEYQTLNLDIAGRLSAIVRGANGGLTVILQNISQIAGRLSMDPTAPSGSELKTIFSNSAIRVCLHNADESTAKFFSDEIGKHAIIVPGLSDHFMGQAGIFPHSWNKIYSQQVVSRIDADSIKRMEKHHALIYLSPAGDTEFGEMKPFMVDLRGIEEIARLHLIHNVTGRSTPPADPSDSPLPPGAPTPPDTTGGAPSSGEPAVTSKLCPHCGQPSGKGRFCIECGRPIISLTGNAAPDGTAPEAAMPAEPLPSGVADVSNDVIQSIFSASPSAMATTTVPVAPEVKEALIDSRSSSAQTMQAKGQATGNVAMPKSPNAPVYQPASSGFPPLAPRPALIQPSSEDTQNAELPVATAQDTSSVDGDKAPTPTKGMFMQPMPGGGTNNPWGIDEDAASSKENAAPAKKEAQEVVFDPILPEESSLKSRPPVKSLNVDPDSFPGAKASEISNQHQSPSSGVEF